MQIQTVKFFACLLSFCLIGASNVVAAANGVLIDSDYLRQAVDSKNIAFTCAFINSQSTPVIKLRRGRYVTQKKYLRQAKKALKAARTNFARSALSRKVSKIARTLSNRTDICLGLFWETSAMRAARADMATRAERIALYTHDGTFMPEGSVIEPNSKYLFTVNLAKSSAVLNFAYINFAAKNSNEPEFEGLYQFRISRDSNTFLQRPVSVDGACNTTIVQEDALPPQNIRVIEFTSPPHSKYYESDGTFTLKQTLLDSNCVETNLTARYEYNDSAAVAPIPPNSGAPLRTYHIRIVNYGESNIVRDEDLALIGQKITQNISSAMKGYFSVVLDGIEQIPVVNDLNRAQIINWYTGVPKTAGLNILDLNDPNQLYLAGLLYYVNFTGPFIESDAKRLYPAQMRGEDLTIYLTPVGAGDTLGHAGLHSNSVNVWHTRAYPLNVFENYAIDPPTYHFDLSLCQFCGATLAEYLQAHAQESRSRATANIVIHELGHALFGLPDIYQKTFPETNAIWSYRDQSESYFRRSEFMSYNRNRSTYDGITFGDAGLEVLLTK